MPPSAGLLLRRISQHHGFGGSPRRDTIRKCSKTYGFLGINNAPKEAERHKGVITKAFPSLTVRQPSAARRYFKRCVAAPDSTCTPRAKITHGRRYGAAA